MQADPGAGQRDLRRGPVRVGAATDVVDVAVLMSDYNLITIPVVDDRRVMIGLITVDDVLEAALPEDWRRREAAEPPDARGGDQRRCGCRFDIACARHARKALIQTPCSVRRRHGHRPLIPPVERRSGSGHLSPE